MKIPRKKKNNGEKKVARSEDIAQRLRTRIAELGLNVVEVAKRAELKPSFLYDIINGKSANPSVVKLARVASELGVDLSYFLTMQTSTVVPLRQLPREVANHNLINTEIDNAVNPQDYVKLLSLRTASEGIEGLVEEGNESEPYFFQRNWIRNHLNANPSDLRIIRVRGDSMEPTLHNNDVILVDLSKNYPTPPGIFVLFDGIGLVAKRIDVMANSTPPSLKIISDNPIYGTYIRLLGDIRVIGRVVWFAREL
jgi:phage repressor protein C with HTH and peptisase S24 domain